MPFTVVMILPKLDWTCLLHSAPLTTLCFFIDYKHSTGLLDLKKHGG